MNPKTATPPKIARRQYGGPQASGLLPKGLTDLPDHIVELSDRAAEAFEAYQAAQGKANIAREALKSAPNIDKAADARAAEQGQPLPEQTTPIRQREADVADRVRDAASVAAWNAQHDLSDALLAEPSLLTDRRSKTLAAIERVRKDVAKARRDGESLRAEADFLVGLVEMVETRQPPRWGNSDLIRGRGPGQVIQPHLETMLDATDQVLIDSTERIEGKA
jgi:chromosome condensin MukBEF ATPase and DNA-binding subunit MukB